MITLNLDRLTPLEQHIFATLTHASKDEPGLTITTAATRCACSVATISKLPKKLGFANYKAFLQFLSGNESPPLPRSQNEFTRLRQFMDGCDAEMIAYFVALINNHNKIILFGYGPSALFAQYLEYKLKVITQKFVITATDEQLAEHLIDENSLLLIFSTTGAFASFAHLQTCANAKKATCLLVVEEYNKQLADTYRNLVFLTTSFQDPSLAAHEKSRAIFFVLFEAVVLQLALAKK